ncbi:MAG: multidrug effflux MFS transporter [Schumannella sp.]
MPALPESAVLHPGDLLSRRRRIGYVLVLGALTGLGPFTLDMYLPAFPLMGEDLAVPMSAIQLTLTGTTVGFGLGQLLMGPFSDRVGRRLPLLLATAVHVLASVGALVSEDIGVLTVFRFLQGAGASAGAVVATAIVRDLFTGHPLVRMLSLLALIFGIAPVVAPVVGSQLLLVTDWRGMFGLLACYGLLILLLAALVVRETLPPERRSVRGHSTTGERFRALARDRVYVGIAVVAGMNFSGLFAYLAASPFLFQEFYDLGPQGYGLLFAANSVGTALGVQTASWLTRRWGPQWILAAAVALQLCAALAIMLLALAGTGFLGVAIPLWFFIVGCGLTFPCVQVLALVGHGAEAGTAASVQGAVCFILGGIVSPVVGLLPGPGAAPMASIMLVAAALGALALWVIVRPATVPPIDG